MEPRAKCTLNTYRITDPTYHPKGLNGLKWFAVLADKEGKWGMTSGSLVQLKTDGRKNAFNNEWDEPIDFGFGSDQALGVVTPPPDDINPFQRNSSPVIRHARDLLYEIRDARTHRLARIKRAIESGSYRVDSYEIAKKMVNDALKKLSPRS